MAIHEYKCRDCHNVVEVFTTLKEEPPTVCPVCGGEDIHKVEVSQSTFALIGDGWYDKDK